MYKFPKWLPIDDVKLLFSHLEEYGDNRLVGGCVRDIISGKESQDIDIATTIKPEKVIEILEVKGIKCVPTGLKHGTVTAVINKKNYEITTLRKDVETFGRHAEVEFTDDWEEDARRRDFTINAMSMDLEDKVYDYFNGQQDLDQKLVKFVGDPETRIKEDFLRILRYFRFYSYFGGTNIDDSSIQACSKLASNVSSLSGERIRLEMLKLFQNPYAVESVMLMEQYNVLRELGIAKPGDEFESFKLSSNSIVNLAALLRNTSVDKGDYSKLCKQWKLSNKEARELEELCFPKFNFEISEGEGAHRKYLYYLGLESYLNYLMLKNIEGPSDSYSDKIKYAKEYKTPTLPINGNDIKSLGFEGVELGKLLKDLEEKWVDSDFSLTKDELLSYGKK